MHTGPRGKTHAATVTVARELRRDQTKAEGILWEALRGGRLCGAKFRRQHPFGKFILDFFCPRHQLAVEVDGSIHDEAGQQNYDEARAEYLADRGIRVLRFRNEDVEQNLPGVLKNIEAALASTQNPGPEHTSPSPICG